MPHNEFKKAHMDVSRNLYAKTDKVDKSFQRQYKVQ